MVAGRHIVTIFQRLDGRGMSGNRDLIYGIRDRFISALRLHLEESTADVPVGDPNEPIDPMQLAEYLKFLHRHRRWSRPEPVRQKPQGGVSRKAAALAFTKKTPHRAARVRRHALRFMC